MVNKDYAICDYITCQSKQRVVTDVTPQYNNIEISMDVSFNNISNTQCLWCSRGSSTESNTYTLFYIGGSGYRFDYNKTLKQTSKKAVVNTKSNVKVNKNEFFVDGVKIFTQTLAQFTCGSPFQLFASHTSNVNSNLGNYASYNFYHCYIKQDNKLIRQFVPCFNVNTDVAGIYDLINDKFYPSNDTAFTKSSQMKSTIKI